MINKAMSEKMSLEEREMFGDAAQRYLEKHDKELASLKGLMTKITIGFTDCGKFVSVGQFFVDSLRLQIIFDYQATKKLGAYTNVIITSHKYALRQLAIKDGELCDSGEYMYFRSLEALIKVSMNVRLIAITLIDVGEKLEYVVTTVNEYLEKQSREDMNVHKVKSAKMNQEAK